MQVGEVIRLEEGVDDHLPVHLALDHPALVKMVAGTVIAFEFRPQAVQMGVDVETLARPRPDPDHAGLLHHRQRPEPVLFQLEVGEAMALRHAGETAVETIRPAVVGTDEVLADASAAADQPRATVAADVDEGADPSVPIAQHHDRHAGKIVGQIVAGLRHLTREPDQQGITPKQHLPLQLQDGTVGVDAGGVSGHLVRQTGRPGRNVPKERSGQTDLGGVIHGLLLAVDARL